MTGFSVVVGSGVGVGVSNVIKDVGSCEVATGAASVVWMLISPADASCLLTSRDAVLGSSGPTSELNATSSAAMQPSTARRRVTSHGVLVVNGA